MKTLLFIDLNFHDKTSSSSFMLDILSREYDVERHCEGMYCLFDNGKRVPELKRKSYDLVVFWQVSDSIKYILPRIRVEHKVFFPMYDDLPSLNGDDDGLNIYLGNLLGFRIICFCRKTYEEFSRLGFDAHYYQYYPSPLKLYDDGAVDSLFFWKRTNAITAYDVSSIFNNLGIRHIHWHDIPDPGNSSDYHQLPQSILQNSTRTDKWFDEKSEMIKLMQESALYLAPREKEGIGMSFLEAMACGRCVIALDSATANEYIRDGWNGLLYKKGVPLKAQSPERIREMQHNALKSVADGFLKWHSDIHIFLRILVAPIKESIPELQRNIYMHTALKNNKRSIWEYRKMRMAHLVRMFFERIASCFHSSKSKKG